MGLVLQYFIVNVQYYCETIDISFPLFTDFFLLTFGLQMPAFGEIKSKFVAETGNDCDETFLTSHGFFFSWFYLFAEV